MGTPSVVLLDDELAADPGLTGAKAAALARALAAGLPALPGAVLTTRFSADIDAGTALCDHDATRRAFDLAGGRHRALVVRSSSVDEDRSGSSMAGQFASVVGARGERQYVDAVRAVLASRTAAGRPGSPIAVLVQPLLEAAAGGVLFGVDPVSGRSDRRVITAVAGGPDRLVSGEVTGSRVVLDATGRTIEADAGDGPGLDAATIRRLLALADDAAATFGGPQDIEWAIGPDGEVRLLQSRPVTTEVRGVPSGPIFGPGPVAETFPDPLAALEADLWVPPLRDALREALVLAAAASPAQVAETPMVVVVDGSVAVDLVVTGEAAPKRSLWRRLSPVAGARRLRSSWRVGRLRGALPGLAEDLLDEADSDLESVPRLGELSSRQLVALLRRGHEALRSLHAHEILMGLLVDAGEQRMTGASVGLRVLAEARGDGRDDAEIVAASPVVLALTAPRVAPAAELPADVAAPDTTAPGPPSSDAGILREALRLRVRWTQDLTARAAWLLGARLSDAGLLQRPERVRHLHLDELEAVVTRRSVPLGTVIAAVADPGGTRLPSCFQLSDRGLPIAVRRDREVGGGTGAGGGARTGPVTFDVDDPPRGSVLVTTTLRPGLGHLLPRLNGIVAETGSVLAHLAILARESQVPTVVGYAGATSQFHEGQRITVDGDRGEVIIDDGTEVSS